MKNTHIIIPIDSINKEIHNLQKRIGITEYGKIKLEVLQDILKENKQISLDEESIEIEAEGYASMYLIEDPDEQDSCRRKHGYKQALRDIIK